MDKPILAMLETMASDEDLFLKISYDRMTIEHILPKKSFTRLDFFSKRN